MSIQVVIESSQSTKPVLQAIESYKTRLRIGIERTRRRLAQFEHRYGITTNGFLLKMTSEDLKGGDLEYVEWAGEAKLVVRPYDWTLKATFLRTQVTKGWYAE